MAELQILSRLNRSMYMANVGKQAPIWNKALVLKRWADRTLGDRQPNDAYRYIYLMSDGTNVIVKENVITVAEAISVNLPGKYSWLKWVPEVVDGYVKSPYDGSVTAINPNFVSTRLQAEEMKDELGGVAIRETTFARFVLKWGLSEERRLFNVKLRGTTNKEGKWNNVGLLLKMKYRQGVGAPGKFESPATEPRWIPKKSEAPDEYDLRPEVPIPVRALLPNESARLGFGGIITIFKDGAGEGSAGGGGELLKKIDETTREILTKVTAPVFSN